MVGDKDTGGMGRNVYAYMYIHTWDIWCIISDDEKASSLLQSSSLRCDQHVCCCFVALFPRAVAEL